MSKLFLGLHNRLMGLLDESTEIVLRERPFLTEGGDPVITNLDEAVDNQLEIQLTVRAMQAEIERSLPKIDPPKQEELL